MANAEIYQKNASDKCLILEPGVGWKQPFDLGSWTQLAIAMYWSATTASNDNAIPVQEDTGTGSVNNLMTWGLKDDNLILPGVTGNNFIGYSATNSIASAARYVIDTSSIHRVRLAGSNNSYLVSIIDTSFTSTFGYTANITNAGNAMSTDTDYASYYALRFTKAGSGATQTIAIARASSTPATSNPTIANLRAAIGTVGFTLGVTTNWNNGVTAYNLPTSMFLRFPFTNVRIRVHAYVIEKLA